MAGNQVYQYTKIKDYILGNIVQNKYVNHKIESENTLAELFHVSRMTVRQALLSLQQDGVIYTLPKKGSFVTKKETFKELDSLHSFSEDVDKLHGQMMSRVILCQKEKLNDQYLQSLNLHNDEQDIWHIQRVRYLNHCPIAYEDGYYNSRLVTKIPMDVLNGSLYTYFEEKMGLKIDYSQQNIDACLANDLATKLQISQTDPLLRVKQMTYLQTGECIEYAYTYYRVDTFTFTQKAYRRKNR